MFAENLIQLRKLNHMSQDELADQIGVRDRHSRNMRQGNPCRISKGAKGSQMSLA